MELNIKLQFKNGWTNLGKNPFIFGTEIFKTKSYLDIYFLQNLFGHNFMP